MTLICDYCNQSGARSISDEGLLFHFDCAEKYRHEFGNIIDQASRPSGMFTYIYIED
jgi:hypothetical protein